MKTPDCERYLADPEANAGHLETCVECRALFGPRSADLPPVRIGALPVAPWEGASYRSWRLVLLAGAIVLTLAAGLGAAAGISPFGGLSAALGSTFPSMEVLQALTFRVGGALQHVPGPWQIGIAISFVVINTVLVILLRRPPKGIDV